MKNQLTACLLAFALCLSGEGRALEAYGGPQDAPVSSYTVGAPASMCPTKGFSVGQILTWAQFSSCMVEWGSGTAFYGRTAGTCTTSAVTQLTPPVTSTIWICATSGGSAGSFGNEVAGCGAATNRALGIVGGVEKCVSLCYALRGQAVTAFVPIDDPAVTMPAACVFITNRGMCQIESVDTSNFTYGSQLYRGGTWDHVGQRCTEDPSDAPTSGAVSSAPTGGTGGGSATGIAEGNTATTDANTISNINTVKTGMEKAADTTVSGLVEGTAPAFLGVGDSRWLLDVSGLFPSASCTLNTGTMTLPLLGSFMSVPMVVDVCAYANYARAFLYWVFAGFTLIGVWLTLFRSN